MRQKKEGVSTLFEKIMYSLGDIGANFCWSFMGGFVTLYYTDSVGIAAGFAGTMMLVARVLDGITDIITGFIMERVHSRWGKARPWLMLSAPLLGISLFLSFHVPGGLGYTGKLIWVSVTYTFTAAVSFTLYNMAFTALLPLMSLDSQDRGTISVMNRICTMSGVLCLNVVTPLLPAFGGGEKAQGAWSLVSVLYAVICAVLVFCMGFFIQEKVPVETFSNKKGDAQNKFSTRETLKAVIFNKYFVLILITFIIVYLFQGLQGTAIYYYRDVLGDMKLYSTMSIVTYLPMIIGMFFVPFLFKKIGRRNAAMCGMAVACVADIVMYLTTPNIPVFCVMKCIEGFGRAPVSASIFTFVADLVDYIVAKRGMHAEGYIAMVSSVGNKIGTGLGSAAIGWGLAWTGYNAGLDVQSQATQGGITFLMAGLPAIIAGIQVVEFALWDMEKKNAELEGGGNEVL